MARAPSQSREPVAPDVAEDHLLSPERVADLAKRHRISPAIVQEIIRRLGSAERSAIEREIAKGKARR